MAPLPFKLFKEGSNFEQIEEPTSLLTISENWISNIELINSYKPKSIMVSGPKNSGKSTFVIALANSITGKVNVLDTDVGQPIFGVPGCI